MRHVCIELAGMTSIDGQTKPAGKFHVIEYEDNEWIGGSYATEQNLSEKIMEILVED